MTVNNFADNLTTKSTIVISGLTGYTSSDGPITATLYRTYGSGADTLTDAGNWTNYLTPDDQTLDSNPVCLLADVVCGGDNTVYSDVNLGADPMAVLTTAIGLPDRIGGNDRYQTSSKIAQNVSECTPVVVIASGNSYADALSGNYLARRLANKFGDWEVWDSDRRGVDVSGWCAGPARHRRYLAPDDSRVLEHGWRRALCTSSAARQRCLRASKPSWPTPWQPTVRSWAAVSKMSWVNNQKIQVTRVGGVDRYATNRATSEPRFGPLGLQQQLEPEPAAGSSPSSRASAPPSSPPARHSPMPWLPAGPHTGVCP